MERATCTPEIPAEVPRLRVLVVDDSRLQRRLLTGSLSRWGFEIFEAESGQEAFDLFLKERPDVVLSDWMMPGMNGLEFCAALRDTPSDNYTYFILLTSKSEKGEIAKGLDVGADDFLTKPVNPHELRARIRAGERLLQMQRDLREKNQVISTALDEIKSLYNAIDSDLMEAKKLQQSLLPERHRDFGGGEVALLLKSSGHVGGDLVGFLPVGSDHLLLYALDVSGHGIASAMLTARISAYLSTPSPDHNLALYPGKDGQPNILPLAEAVQALNETLLDDLETEHYFTLLLADANLRTGEVTMCQAGHPHPSVLDTRGRVTSYGSGGLPVGLIPGAAFDEFKVKLSPGDRLLFLSDGVIESKDKDGLMLGEEGLAQMLRQNARLANPALLEAIMWDLNDFVNGADLDDDVSALLYQFHGSN